MSRAKEGAQSLRASGTRAAFAGKDVVAASNFIAVDVSAYPRSRSRAATIGRKRTCRITSPTS
jgi:hypothetical protein